MAIHIRQPRDLSLAPVAARVDSNLQRIRGWTAQQVAADLELELDTPALDPDRAERERLVVRQAIRNVDMHGWRASISDDGHRLRLDGGSVSLELGLSAGITSYIKDGVVEVSEPVLI